MKYRMFIGSSTESLDIAYAIQECLQHDLECTVWSQGIFEPSATALESLTRESKTFEYACFVFKPDDILRLRGVEHEVVRDNVIFELGLFVGQLGIENTFFLQPQGAPFHLPTDMLGLNPLSYDPARSDGNLLAALGPATNQIRRLVKGRVERPVGKGTAEENDQKPSSTERQARTSDWVDYYIKDEYEKSLAALNAELEKGNLKTEKLDNVTWKGVLTHEIDRQEGIRYLRDLIDRHPDQQEVYYQLARCHYSTDDYQLCQSVLDEAKGKGLQSEDLKVLAMDIVAETKLNDEAMEALKKIALANSGSDKVVLRYVSYLKEREKHDEVKLVLLPILKNSRSRGLRSELAEACWQLKEYPLALYLYLELLKEDEKNSSYWGYLGNVYLDLEMLNLALAAYERADFISPGQSWIVANIGNLYKNAKLYSKADGFLRTSATLDPKSLYTQKRMVELLENFEKEGKARQENVSKGRAQYQQELSNI